MEKWFKLCTLLILSFLEGYAAKVMDLTYTFDDKTIYVPTHLPFKLTTFLQGMHPNGFWYVLMNHHNNYSEKVNPAKDIRQHICL